MKTLCVLGESAVYDLGLKFNSLFDWVQMLSPSLTKSGTLGKLFNFSVVIFGVFITSNSHYYLCC